MLVLRAAAIVVLPGNQTFCCAGSGVVAADAHGALLAGPVPLTHTAAKHNGEPILLAVQRMPRPALYDSVYSATAPRLQLPQ